MKIELPDTDAVIHLVYHKARTLPLRITGILILGPYFFWGPVRYFVNLLLH